MNKLKDLHSFQKKQKQKKARERAENLKIIECYTFDIKPAAVCGVAVFGGFLAYKYFLVLNKKNLKKDSEQPEKLKKACNLITFGESIK